MTRRSLSKSLSNEELSLDEAWGWYEFQRTLIGDEKNRVMSIIASGAEVFDLRYFDKSQIQLNALFEFQIAELENCAMLGILASAEAALHVDFIIRVQNRRKDAVSRAYRSAHKTRPIERRLEEDILNNLRDYANDKRIDDAVADFKGALHLRHWLAHGRYWISKSHHIHDYHTQDVFDICKTLIGLVALMP